MLSEEEAKEISKTHLTLATRYQTYIKHTMSFDIFSLCFDLIVTETTKLIKFLSRTLQSILQHEIKQQQKVWCLHSRSQYSAFLALSYVLRTEPCA